MYPVLIVEDEKPIADLIDLTLRRMQYQCVKVYSGEDAAGLIVNRRFDLILLDVMLPGIDGFALSDYIVKPFAPEELLARVDGLMRRTGRRSARLRLWQVKIDPDARQVLRDGRPVELTPREFDLLMVLVQSRGVALYRNVLMERVWGLDSDAGPRTLDLYISRLRKKLGWADKIRTVSGVGYRLEARP